MGEVIYTYTTTNGGKYAVVSTGSGTGDVETIKLSDKNDIVVQKGYKND